MESFNLLINILLKQFKLYARSYKDKVSLVKNIPQRTEAIAMNSHTFFLQSSIRTFGYAVSRGRRACSEYSISPSPLPRRTDKNTTLLMPTASHTNLLSVVSLPRDVNIRGGGGINKTPLQRL